MNSTAMKSQMSAFQLKGSVLTLTVLELLKVDITSISAQLSSLTHRTPDLFKRMPIIIDLKNIKDNASHLDFNQLKITLQENGFIPIGVKNGSNEQQTSAVDAGLGILNDHAPTSHSKENRTKKESAKHNTDSSENHIPTSAKIINHPVRSGQQIYAKDCDLIILASVSPGAEILACGNIHIYGTLHGRALAGVSGNKNARIFCRSLKAELVSIAGHYWMSEDISSVMSQNKQKEKENFLQIYLDHEKESLQMGIV